MSSERCPHCGKRPLVYEWNGGKLIIKCFNPDCRIVMTAAYEIIGVWAVSPVKTSKTKGETS